MGTGLFSQAQLCFRIRTDSTWQDRLRIMWMAVEKGYGPILDARSVDTELNNTHNKNVECFFRNYFLLPLIKIIYI